MNRRTGPPRPSGLELSPIGGPAVLAVCGELDGNTAPQFRACLDGLIAAGEQTVVLDLGGLTFMDSKGIGVLVWAAKRLRGADGDLVLRSPTPQTVIILQISGLDRVLTVEK